MIAIVMTYLFDLTQRFGRVQMTGRTRLEFLHRMSTGDVSKLTQGQGAATVLTTPIGRMVDLTPTLALDDAVILLTGANHAAQVVQWLRRYVLYNDEVKVHDISAATQMAGLFGAQADPWLQSLNPEAYAALRDAPIYASVQQGQQLWVKAPPLSGAGYYVVGVGALAQVKMGLGVDVAVAPIAEYESLRIAHGYPTFPNEISEDYIPLEAGLWDAVSFSKGCYIGQEIIARMESRNQMAKRLVQLALNVSPNDDAVSNAVVAVTSQTDRVALAYVRSAFANVGQILRLDDGHVARVNSVIDTRVAVATG